MIQLKIAEMIMQARHNRKLFVDKDLTQKKMASLLGVSKSTYSRWENGKIAIPLVYFDKICAILEKDVKYFFDGIKE